MPEIPVRLSGVAPILPVPDVSAAASYYRDRLGFPDVWCWGDPPTHAGAVWGRSEFQFTLQPEAAARAAGTAYFVRVSGIEALHARHLEAGVEIAGPLEHKPWGMREYTVRDLNGYLLRFAMPAAEGKPSRPLPASIGIEPRLPDLADYERLLLAVGWEPYVNWERTAAALSAAAAGVTAVDRERDQVIGCGLLLGDGAGLFYVKDVMVQPEYQGRGVGKALMEALMAWLEQHAPERSLVGLFTGENLAAFYERWGFRGPESLYGMTRRL